MKRLKFLNLFLWLFLFFPCLFFPWDALSVRFQSRWTVDTVEDRVLRPHLLHNSPPLILGALVVQGNAINGIKAYDKETGEELWGFDVPSGVASPVAFHKGRLYFGGADGFFYSLQADTGRLNWKFWTGSENSGPPLIHKGKLYWTAHNQKLYALSLKGKLVWIYSGPSLPRGFVVRGRPRPALYKNWIYTGFYDGSLAVLNKETGKLKWKLSLPSSQPIREGLELSGGCLFVPIFDSNLFCLNPLNGKIRWKAPGGSSVQLSGRSVLYQWDKGTLSALNKRNAERIWQKKIETGEGPFPPTVFGGYLIYGFSSTGKLVFANAKNGKTLGEYRFGRGLAAPISVDPKDNAVYFISIDGYLRKLSIL